MATRGGRTPGKSRTKPTAAAVARSDTTYSVFLPRKSDRCLATVVELVRHVEVREMAGGRRHKLLRYQSTLTDSLLLSMVVPDVVCGRVGFCGCSGLGCGGGRLEYNKCPLIK